MICYSRRDQLQSRNEISLNNELRFSAIGIKNKSWNKQPITMDRMTDKETEMSKDARIDKLGKQQADKE